MNAEGTLALPWHGGIVHPLGPEPAPRGGVITLPNPERVFLAWLDTRGNALPPGPEIGTRVAAGEWLGDGLISPVHGMIKAWHVRPAWHPAQLPVPVLEIQADEEQLALPDGSADRIAKLPRDWFDRLSPEFLEQAAIRGLGGAAFPLSIKLSGSPHRPIELYAINAMECEPWISCDNALMLAEADRIIAGVLALTDYSGAQKTHIAIEDNKPMAERMLRNVLIDAQSHVQPRVAEIAQRISIHRLPTRYPGGAEKLLLETLTGTRLKGSERPIDRGWLCSNIGTVHALASVMHGQPPLSRVVSIAGPGAQQLINARVRFGTPIADVLRLTGNLPPEGTRIRIGGPLSGIDLPDADYPVNASCNCIVIKPPTRHARVQPCIRCGDCTTVCPVNLKPQQLYWHARKEDIDGSVREGLRDCIECGCCDLVCPSSIPLTAWFRHARVQDRVEQQRERSARAAEARHAAREARIAKREAEREAARAARKAKRASASPTPDAAIARNAPSMQSELDAVRERAEAAKAARAASAAQPTKPRSSNG